MRFQDRIISQYLAALEMLKQAIVNCPVAMWNDPVDKTPFWRIAYHALFFTHLYLQDSSQAFTPWSKHRQDYESLGPFPPHELPQSVEPFDKATVLEYLVFCQQEVVERMPQKNLEAASGFYWLPFSKFELQIYSIRHLQQHTGELMERGGTRADVEINWVSMVEQERPS